MTHNLGGAPRENVSSVAIVGRSSEQDSPPVR